MKKSLLLSTALVAVFAATQAFARDIITGEVNISNIENKTFLELCLGVGSFVFAYLINIDKLNLGQDIIKKIINNIYVCEINDIAVEEYKKLFTQFVYSFFHIELDENYFTNRIANGLLYNMDVKDFRYIDIQNVFPEIMARGGFDIVATNPPYKNLKAEKNKYKSIVEYENDKNIYEKISKVKSNSPLLLMMKSRSFIF